MIRMVMCCGLVVFSTQLMLISAPAPQKPPSAFAAKSALPSSQSSAIMSSSFSSPLPVTVSSTSATDFKTKLMPYQQRITAFKKTTSSDEIKNTISGFLKEILNPALTQQDLSLSTLNDILTLSGRAISNLASITNQLISVKGSESQRATISRFLKELKSKNSTLGRKYQKQKVFMNLLQSARSVPMDQFEQKTSKYSGIIAQIDSELLEETKLEFIKDLELMAVYAKGKGGNDRVLLDKVINTALANPAFSFKQRQQIAGVFEAKPQLDATKGVQLPQALAGIKGDIIFDAKYKEVLAKPTTIEKIAGAKELLALITAAAVQVDKNTFSKFCETLINALVSMNKTELKELSGLLKEVIDNPFLLAPAQKPVVTQWAELVTQALVFAEDRPLLQSLKAKMTNEKQDYNGALQAALFAIKILESKFLKPEELNKRTKGGLVYIFRDQLSSYYNNRADKNVDDLKSLKTLLELAKLKPNLNEVIKPTWANTLTVGIALKEVSA